MATIPQNIIVIGSAHPLRGGGISTFNERLARELMQHGHKVKIFSFSLQYPNLFFPGTTQYTKDPAPPDLEIHSKINSLNPFNWFWVGNIIRRLKPDLIVVRFWLPFMGPSLGTILRIVKLNRHTRIICIADNIIPHEKRTFDRPFTWYFVKPIDAFITMSESVLADLKKFVSNKPAKYIPHPLYDNFGAPVPRHEARKQLRLSYEGPIILFFGFIRKYKGLDILLDAMKILHDNPKTSNIRLLVAGEFYDNPEPYLNQITALGIKEKLMLRTDFIANESVKYFLGAADVVVQPYRNATQSGVTPLAYHFEKPMIVTNVGGLHLLVPDGTVGLVASPDAASIAEKIEEYFDKGEQFFLPHLLKEKKKYTWDNMVSGILNEE